MDTYQETEQLAIGEKKKRLHYERIRITEDKEDHKKQTIKVDKKVAKIDGKVFEDTKE